jgi:hypothetical protein
MVQRNTHSQKRLVGNDIVSAHRLKSTAKPKPKVMAKPMIISDMRLSKKHVLEKPSSQKVKQQVSPRPIKESPKTVEAPKLVQEVIEQSVKATQATESTSGQRGLNQAFINAIAYDSLIIVVFGYVAYVSKWILFVVAAYTIIVLLFKFASRRMFISATICLVLSAILKLLQRAELTKSFLELTVFFISIGAIRMVFEYYVTKHNKL